MNKKYQKYFVKLTSIENSYYSEVDDLEKEMKKELGETIEFFWVDNEVVGIGNKDRSMKLINRKE
jgi:hypothetical protein